MFFGREAVFIVILHITLTEVWRSARDTSLYLIFYISVIVKWSTSTVLMLNPLKLRTTNIKLVFNNFISFFPRAHIFLFVLDCRMGAKWQRIRSILNPRMLKPKHVSSYTTTINEVVTDFIKRVAWLKETSGQGVMVNDLAGELYKFAFEGQQRQMKCLHWISCGGSSSLGTWKERKMAPSCCWFKKSLYINTVPASL